VYPTASVVDDKIYTIGGTKGVFDNLLNSVEEYIKDNNSWILKSEMPTARGASVAGVINGKIYVASGRVGFKDSIGILYPRTKLLEMYNPQTDSWSSLAPIPTSRVHICGGVVNDRLFVIGGNQNRGKIIEEYDPATNTWTRKSDMPGQGRFAAAAAVIDNMIYVIGGSYGGGQIATSNVYAYNTISDTWRELIELPITITEAGVEVYNNKIYIIGGAMGTYPYTPLSTVYEYDPQTYTGE
jgi:N-acetylneuraminic acid mutarotase